MNKIYLIIFLLAHIHTVFSQEYSISGNAATYSGNTLKMYVYSDYITKTKQEISICTVEENGDFSFNLNLKDTIQAFIDLDVFIGKIIIEPGKNFKIVLPRKTVRSEYDRLNPYFKPFEFYIRIINNDHNVTTAIKHLNTLYEESTKLIFKDKSHINSGIVEKEILKMEDSTTYNTSSFFMNYKSYKFLYLRHVSFYKNKKAIIRKDFSEKEILYNNPSYNEMLEESFATFATFVFLDSIPLTIPFHSIPLYSFLSANYSWNTYMNYLAKDRIYFNKDFREYIFLLNLKTLFYKNSAYQKNIIKLMRSAKEENISKQSEKIIYNFLNQSSRLILGNPVADFSLPDESGIYVSLDEFRDHFVYLCFYDKDSYACQKDIELLNQINKKEIDLLKIVTVFKDDDLNYIKELKEKTDYDWTLLQCSKNDKILKNYKVAAYPTYYLIHPTGTLSLLPAPGPAENFESEYYKVYQIWKRKLTREGN